MYAMKSIFNVFFLFAMLAMSTSNNGVALAMTLRKDPLKVNNKITVVGTSYVSATKYDNAKIDVPSGTKEGDMLVILIAGSYAGNSIPSGPIPSSGWKQVTKIGPADLNLKAYVKAYKSSDKDFTIKNGKSTFVSLVSLRGVSKNKPVVDKGASKDAMKGRTGRKGEALAPSVKTVSDGIVMAIFAYDDPHESKILGKHNFDMLLSTTTRAGDGMAIGVGRSSDGESGNIYAESGEFQSGGGNEIGMAISFRASLDMVASGVLQVDLHKQDGGGKADITSPITPPSMSKRKKKKSESQGDDSNLRRRV